MAGDNKVTIAGETWELRPLMGLDAIRVMPKVLSIGSQLAYAAIQSGLPVDKWLQGDTEIKVSIGEAINALSFISVALGKNFDTFEKEVVPFLLQKPYPWLKVNGTIGELFTALWIATKYHVRTSLGQDAMDALKNSLAAEEQAESQETTG